MFWCCSPQASTQLVAEDALRVVADVQLVVDLDRLVHRRRRAAVRDRRGAPCAPGRARRSAARAGRSAPGCGVVALEVARARRASSRGRPRRRAAPSRAFARGARARSPCAPSSPPRPCASRTGRARASPRARRRRRGRRWPGRSVSSKQSVGVSISSVRQASRIVAPSNTRTGCPSTSSSTIRLRLRAARSCRLLLEDARAGRWRTRPRSTPSGRARRSRRRACTGRPRR